MYGMCYVILHALASHSCVWHIRMRGALNFVIGRIQTLSYEPDITYHCKLALQHCRTVANELMILWLYIVEGYKMTEIYNVIPTSLMNFFC